MSPYATLFSPAQPYSSGRFAPKTPSSRHLRDELLREAALDVGVADDRQDALVDEAADAVADGALLFGERAVDVEEVEHGARVGMTLPAKASQPSRAARRPSVCEPSARPGRVASTRRADGAIPTSRAFARNVAPWSIGCPVSSCHWCTISCSSVCSASSQPWRRRWRAADRDLRRLARRRRRRVVPEPRSACGATRGSAIGLQRAAEVPRVVPARATRRAARRAARRPGACARGAPAAAADARSDTRRSTRCAARRSARVRPSTKVTIGAQHRRPARAR